MRNLYPTETVQRVALPFGQGAFSVMSYRPWLDERDGDDVLFISSHGYGLRDQSLPEAVDNPWFYPGSGAPVGWEQGAVDKVRDEAAAAATAATAAAAAASAAAVPTTHGEPPVLPPGAAAPGGGSPLSPAAGHRLGVNTAAAERGGVAPPLTARRRPPPPLAHATFVSPATATGEASELSLQPAPVPEGLFEGRVRHPHIINVGLRRGLGPKAWRRIMTADVLPRLAAFKPDLIFVSAGFDAHHKVRVCLGWGMRVTGVVRAEVSARNTQQRKCPPRLTPRTPPHTTTPASLCAAAGRHQLGVPGAARGGLRVDHAAAGQGRQRDVRRAPRVGARGRLPHRRPHRVAVWAQRRGARARAGQPQRRGVGHGTRARAAGGGVAG